MTLALEKTGEGETLSGKVENKTADLYSYATISVEYHGQKTVIPLPFLAVEKN